MRVKPALDAGCLRRHWIVAIVRGSSAVHFRSIAEALTKSGIGIVEFPLTTPGVLQSLPQIIQTVGDHAYVGVGSVTTKSQVSASCDAGADFLVTPNFDPHVVAQAVQLEIPTLVGAFTPSEIFAAWQAGATAVKLFPASIGGPAYVAELTRGPFPDIPLVPTGGISVANAAEYCACGAVALGLGSSLVGAASESGDLSALSQRATEFRSASMQVDAQP